MTSRCYGRTYSCFSINSCSNDGYSRCFFDDSIFSIIGILPYNFIYINYFRFFNCFFCGGNGCFSTWFKKSYCLLNMQPIRIHDFFLWNVLLRCKFIPFSKSCIF
uniref:Putative orf104 protein n=1 Tax=Chondrus crispus TaxID=2769 RepID=Q36339_CHOCR|nr:putative orf104 [Chondrus crispus]